LKAFTLLIDFAVVKPSLQAMNNTCLYACPQQENVR